MTGTPIPTTQADPVERAMDRAEAAMAERRTRAALELARLREEHAAIEAAARTVCPIDHNEGYEDLDEGRVMYRCLGESGAPVIEAVTPAEVLTQMSERWAQMQAYAERMRDERDALAAKITESGRRPAG